jgi:hypothetical protein
MNILEIEDIIKGLPDQSLIQEAQAPSGQMPQFLVVSEIQRRADMRKRFQNQQQEMPQGTIADQIVQGGIMAMGNRQPIQPMPPQGMPQGMPPMPPQGMPQGMPQQGMPMQQQPPMMPPMSPPMMPPAQGMAGGGVVRMQTGELVPYTGGTKAYQNLIDQALMAGGTSRDIQALIGGNPEAQAVYNSMRGPNPQTASIPYGEEFDGRKAVVGGSPGYTPYYLSNSDEDRRKALLENIEYNQRQQEIISGRNPEADYIPAYLSNFASMPDTQGATSDSIRSQNQRQQNKLDQIRNQTDEESIFDIERFFRMMEMNSPNYSLVGSGLGFNPQENLLNRNESAPAQQARSPSIGSSVLKDKLAEALTKEETALEQFNKMGEENRIKNELLRQQNMRDSIFQGTGPINLFEDKRGSPPYNFMATPPIDKSIFYSPSSIPLMEKYDSMTNDFLAPYLNPQLDVSSDAAGGNAQKADTKRFGEGTRTANPETTAEAIETGMNTGSSEKTVQKDLSKDSDYSSLQAVIDEFKPVDYSAFKPDYLNLITEQERRAQKIRDDASKDASAQALIQLGAGLAAGDISKGLSAAGQSVADIKRQARAEARDEEGFARQLRLAQDEAGMQLGIKGAEAEREMARFKATYGVSLKELENTMTLAREQIAAEKNTEAGRALRGELDALNNLIKNLMSEQYEGDIEQNKAAIAQAVSRMQFLLGVTGEKQDKEKDPLGIGV